jgi:predicted Zn-dependent peptidase
MRSLPVLALLLSAGGLRAQQFPTTPPPPSPVKPGSPLAAQEFTLLNGLSVTLIEIHRQPVVSMHLSVPAGTAFDPAGKQGTAELLAGLITRGAGTHDADAVAAMIESVGGSLSAAVDPDFLTVEADALSSSAELALGLMADAVLRPHLDPEELARARQQTITSLQGSLVQPASAASRVFLAALYGNHPYGAGESPATVSNISRSDLEAFRLAHFRPANAQLVIAGDLTLADARRIVTSAFGEWRGTAAPPLAAAAPGRSPTRIVLVHFPGASSSSILLGNTTLRGSDTTYYAATVLNRILGGGTDNRLTRVLRDQRGWAVNPASGLSRPAGPGMFQAGVEVKSEVTDSVVREILAQMRTLRSDTVPLAELAPIREVLAGEQPLGLQTVNQIADEVTKLRQAGLPLSSLAGYRGKVLGLSAVRLRTVARTILKPDSAMVVVIGDAGRLYRPLSALAPVRLVAPDGTAMKPEDVEPKPTALLIDPKLLVERKDSLLVVAQGRPVGLQVSTLVRNGGNLVYTEATTVGNAISQTSTVTLDTLGLPLKLVQRGRLQGQDTKVELNYGKGRVTGSANVIGANGPTSFTVDTVVPADILDDNGLQAVLPALNWGPNVRWTVPVFASGQNRIRDLTLTVRAIGTVSVPAGSFQAYLADLEGDQQKVTFYLSVATPHRILRITIAGTPLEFVAASGS